MTTYSNVWSDTIPPGTAPANTIDDIIRAFRVDVDQRIADLHGITDFTSDPLNSASIRVGYTGFGGYVRITDQTNVVRFLAGCIGNAGDQNYYIYDSVNGTSRFSVNATTGDVSVSNSLYVTGTIHAPLVVAPVSGNVTGNVSGSSGSCTGNAATASSIPAGGITGSIADSQISGLTASKLSGALPALNGSNLTSLTGANVTGTVANASYAATAGAASTATNATYATSSGVSASCSGNSATATYATNAGTSAACSGNSATASSSPANSLTGSTLAAGVTSSSLTSTGTLSSLVVSGTTNFNGNISFFGNAPVGQQSAPSITASQILTGLQNLGLFS